MSKEIPILYSTPMVKSIVAGIKKMTRRTKGLEFINDSFSEWEYLGLSDTGLHLMKNEHGATNAIKCPYGNIGDILWVRETWAQWDYPEKAPFEYAYKADGFIERYGAWERDTPKRLHDVERIEKWKPSIFMPKEACRIWLKVTDVWVERLQDISIEDAMSEGIEMVGSNPMDGTSKWKLYPDGNPVTHWWSHPVDSFKSLWQSINGNWEENPWVWVILFEKINKQ